MKDKKKSNLAYHRTVSYVEDFAKSLTDCCALLNIISEGTFFFPKVITHKKVRVGYLKLDFFEQHIEKTHKHRCYYVLVRREQGLI